MSQRLETAALGKGKYSGNAYHSTLPLVTPEGNLHALPYEMILQTPSGKQCTFEVKELSKVGETDTSTAILNNLNNQ